MERDAEQLARDIEALLFIEGEALGYKKLGSLLSCDMVELGRGLDRLKNQLEGRGLALLRTETEVALAVAPRSEQAVKNAEAAETKGDIGDAGLEVLAILLYRGASARADIDYVRGVNSSFTIRVLLARGLVERVRNPNDSREFLYRATVELLAHLGITEGKEAPEYATITAELAAFEASREPFGQHGEPQSGNGDAGNA